MNDALTEQFVGLSKIFVSQAYESPLRQRIIRGSRLRIGIVRQHPKLIFEDAGLMSIDSDGTFDD
jgi:hypothetical protein